MKHAVRGFSSVTLPLALLLVGVVAAQSAPPRKDIPAIVKAANDRGQAPVKISDAFAKAEVLALQAIEIEKADSTLVTRPDGSFVTRSETALDVAKSEAVSSQEKLISSLVERIYEYKVVSDYPSEVLEKSPTLEKDVKGFSSRINACISAEKDALRRRSAEVPKACNDEVISPPKTKEEVSALQRKINAEVQTAERGADTVAANDPERQPRSQSAPPRKDIPAIAKAANGAIVSIIMSDKDGHAIAQGSGFLIGNDGVILTNYHVIAEGSSAVVKLPEGAFYVVDGVLAFDKARDVAVIKAHGENFRTLTLGNSDRLQVGEEVVAIGNPLSLESTVSNGIVSGIRTVEEEGGKFLQVTTPISPGSSGGPLFNMAGEVVGITTLYLKGGENLNFAIPINDAKGLLLAKSSKIQALPNETDPVKAQTPGGNAPSSVASPSAGSTAVGYAATAEQIDCRARADGMLQEERKRYSDPPGLYTITHATDSSHVDPVGTGICFVLLDIAVSVKHTDGKTESMLSLDVLDAIGRTNYAEYFVDTVDNVPEIACSVKRPGWAAPRICTTADEFTRLINMLFGL